MRIIIALAVMLVSISCSIADYWSSAVETNTSTWSIYRQNNNVSFNLTSSVEGNIAPITVRERVLKPYHSYYAEVKENDVRLSQRTSALEGYYKSDELISLRSRNMEDIEISIEKPNETNIYTFSFKELWPVSIITRRTLDYSGRLINNKDLEVIDRDQVGANLLYNRNLSIDRKAIMRLNRLNATVLATDDAILLAEIQPTKYLGYLANMHTSGMADLTYTQTESRYDPKRRMYPVLIDGDERYFGTYDLARRIEISSNFSRSNDTDDEELSGYDWLPCC